VWVLIGFLSGSIPYSLLLGYLFLKKDIRTYGDGNPGATNLVRAGGGWLGFPAILLDGFKAAVPVGLAYWFSSPSPIWMIVIALAPVIGHAYSPFLKGKGGKAVAATFGVWAGLTWFEAPIIFGLFCGLFYLVLENSGWAIVLAELGLLVYLLIYHPAPLLLAVWCGLFILMVWKQRDDLRHQPGLRTIRLTKNS
jgi:acyl phosphate:glycerol-3-phosphate acyltransferase